MKNILVPLLIFILAFSNPSNLFAQESMPRLAIGAKGGFQNSFMDFGSLVNVGYLPGITAGFHLQYMSRKMLGFETGLLFTQIGWEEVAGRRKINAIEIPLTSHLAIGKGPVRILLDAGPYVRFFLNQANEGSTLVSSTSYENQDTENTSSYGLCFAGGLGWRNPKLIIQLRGNFHLGLTNYYPPTVNDITLSAERSAGGTISILFPIGQKLIVE